MARVFKHTYTRKVNGTRVTKKTRKYCVEYRDAQGILRRRPGYTDRKAIEQLASELERRAAREQSGLVDKYAEHRKRPLLEHVDDYEDRSGLNPAEMDTYDNDQHEKSSSDKLRRTGLEPVTFGSVDRCSIQLS